MVEITLSLARDMCNILKACGDNYALPYLEEKIKKYEDICKREYEKTVEQWNRAQQILAEMNEKDTTPAKDKIEKLPIVCVPSGMKEDHLCLLMDMYNKINKLIDVVNKL